MCDERSNINNINVSSPINYHKTKRKCLIKCCKKSNQEQIIKKQQLNSDITNILTYKKDLLKLDKTSSFTKLSSNAGHSNFTMKSTLRKKDNELSPLYSKKFFHEFKDKLRCFFCQGQNCKHENFKTNLRHNNAIYGLHSNYITPDIIASQRPSEVLISKYNLLSVFKEKNIGLIVNLQREGEHPYCGPNAYNLTPSGYSYNPTVFSGDDIKCKLSGWKDMGVPSSMNFMLDIVKSMSEVVIDCHKKVLVHCHAGYGRTGIVIACYMLFNSEKTSDEVIKEIRQKRKNCIETKNQKHYCRKFEEFLKQTRILFGPKEKIDVYLKRQEDLLFGEQSRKYGYIPKLITKILVKIIEIKNTNNLSNLHIYQILQGILLDWNDDLESVLLFIKSTLNKNNWTLFEETENLRILSELLFDWIEDCVECLISPERTEMILSNDLFLSYQGKDKSSKEQIKNLLSYIKKIYLCYEYEMLFQFASFFTMVKPQNENENFAFMEMIDRISLELLGFNLCKINNDTEYMKSTKPLVTGLSSILHLIYDSLEDNEIVSFANPTRVQSKILKNNYVFSKKGCENEKSQTVIKTTNDKNRASLFSAEKKHFKSTKEKTLFQMYSLLEQHFHNRSNSNNMNQLTNIFHPNEKDNMNDDALKHKKIVKMIEQILSKQMNQSNTVSDLSKNISKNGSFNNNSDNSSISLKKSFHEYTEHVLNNQEIPSNMERYCYILGQKHKKPNMTLLYKKHNLPLNLEENVINTNKISNESYLKFESFIDEILKSKTNFKKQNNINPSNIRNVRNSIFNRNECDFSQMKKQFSKGDGVVKDIKCYEQIHNLMHTNEKLRNAYISKDIKVTKHNSHKCLNQHQLHISNINYLDLLKNKLNIGND